MDTVFGKYGLTLGAFGVCVFAGFFWGVPNALKEIEGNGRNRLPAAPLWGFLVRYVCPIAILIILGMVVTGKANF